MKRKLSQREQMIRKFKKFLYDNNALTEWTRNVEKYGFYGMNANKVFRDRPVKEWINSFGWSTSKERVDYWAELSVKWHLESSE